MFDSPSGRYRGRKIRFRENIRVGEGKEGGGLTLDKLQSATWEIAGESYTHGRKHTRIRLVES
jgi:hypothetical protein